MSSGAVLFFWPLTGSISMSPSRFLNHSIATFVAVFQYNNQLFAPSPRFAQRKSVGDVVGKRVSTWTNTSRVENKGRSPGVSKLGPETGHSHTA